LELPALQSIAVEQLASSLLLIHRCALAVGAAAQLQSRYADNTVSSAGALNVTNRILTSPKPAAKAVFWLAALLALPSCREPASPLTVCETVTLDVDLSGVPVFSWTPTSCGFTDIMVWDSGSRVWHVYVSISEPLIGSGVTYGITPRGARTRVEPQPLVAGRTYRLEVVWGEGDDAFIGTAATFTR
jgi:hypothetical protein